MIDNRHIVTRVGVTSDAPAIAHIYNQGIAGRNATFETKFRSPDDVMSWMDDPRHPLLVAAYPTEAGEEVIGWIHASTYRPRECYAGIGEFSVYVADEAKGIGAGSRLMEAFLPACAEAGLWKVLSRIFVENRASLALCRKHGFREVGIYEKHGQLDGVWRDVVIVERLLLK